MAFSQICQRFEPSDQASEVHKFFVSCVSCTVVGFHGVRGDDVVPLPHPNGHRPVVSVVSKGSAVTMSLLSRTLTVTAPQFMLLQCLRPCGPHVDPVPCTAV